MNHVGVKWLTGLVVPVPCEEAVEAVIEPPANTWDWTEELATTHKHPDKFSPVHWTHPPPLLSLGVPGAEKRMPFAGVIRSPIPVDQ